MTKVERDFLAREPWEQRWLIENTWCDICNEADLGLFDPIEYEENNKIFIEGKCGSRVISGIIENNKTD